MWVMQPEPAPGREAAQSVVTLASIEPEVAMASPAILGRLSVSASLRVPSSGSDIVGAVQDASAPCRIRRRFCSALNSGGLESGSQGPGHQKPRRPVALGVIAAAAACAH